MALIECPECHKSVSNQSEVCIHCGYPIKRELKQIEKIAAVCPKCGNAIAVLNGPSYAQDFIDNLISKPCQECGNQMEQHLAINPPSVAEIELFYEYYNNLVGGTINKELYMKWQNERTKQVAEIMSRPTTPTCPYCNSVSTRKISTLSRAFSTGLFGLGSSKVGKQWHCNKCGSDF